MRLTPTSLRLLVVLMIPAVLAGCSAAHSKSPAARNDGATAPAKTEEPKKSDDDTTADELADTRLDRAKLDRDLAIAREKVAQTELAGQQQQAASRDALARAEKAVEISTNKLRFLETQDAPARLEQARLGFQGAQDGVQESREELTQLEEMYKETELADKTREIVIQRAKRRLARAEWYLKNEQKSLELLEKERIPLEIADARKQLDVDSKALAEEQRKAAAGAVSQKIDLLNAQSEVTRIEAEIAKLDRKLARLDKKLAEKAKEAAK